MNIAKHRSKAAKRNPAVLVYPSFYRITLTDGTSFECFAGVDETEPKRLRADGLKIDDQGGIHRFSRRLLWEDILRIDPLSMAPAVRNVRGDMWLLSARFWHRAA